MSFQRKSSHEYIIYIHKKKLKDKKKSDTGSQVYLILTSSECIHHPVCFFTEKASFEFRNKFCIGHVACWQLKQRQTSVCYRTRQPNWCVENYTYLKRGTDGTASNKSQKCVKLILWHVAYKLMKVSNDPFLGLILCLNTFKHFKAIAADTHWARYIDNQNDGSIDCQNDRCCESIPEFINERADAGLATNSYFATFASIFFNFTISLKLNRLSSVISPSWIVEEKTETPSLISLNACFTTSASWVLILWTNEFNNSVSETTTESLSSEWAKQGNAILIGILLPCKHVKFWTQLFQVRQYPYQDEKLDTKGNKHLLISHLKKSRKHVSCYTTYINSSLSNKLHTKRIILQNVTAFTLIKSDDILKSIASLNSKWLTCTFEHQLYR